MSVPGPNARWICPNDRELMLRSRLSDGSGWCTRSSVSARRSVTSTEPVSANELAIIEARLKVAQEYEQIEANRVMLMLTKLDRIRKGPTVHASPYMCDLCGTAFNLITKLQMKTCAGCNRRVCRSCGYVGEVHTPMSSGNSSSGPSPSSSPFPDSRPSSASATPGQRTTPPTSLAQTNRQSLQSKERTSGAGAAGLLGAERRSEKKQWICLYCSECQEVWKKSGAWFHGGISTELLAQASEALAEVSSYSRSRINETRPSTAIGQIGGEDLAKLRAIAGASGNSILSDDSDSSKPESEDTDDDILVKRARDFALIKREETSSKPFPPQVIRSRSDNIDQGARGAETGDVRQRTKAFSSAQDSPKMGGRGRKVKLSQRRARRTDQKPESSDGAGSEGTHVPSPVASRNSSPVTERRKKQTRGQAVFKRQGKQSVRPPMHHESSSEQEVDATTMDIDALVSEVKTKERIARTTSNPGASASIASAASSHVNLGRIFFSVSYDTEESRLSIDLHSCSNLRAMDRSGFSDPFVILQLMSAGKTMQEKRTGIVKRSLDPVFNERFQYHAVSEAELSAMKLRLQVYDHDRVTKHDFIGEASFSLSVIHPDTVDSFRLDLEAKNEELARLERLLPESAPYGKVLISLNFLSVEEVLLVNIVRAAGLPAMDTNGLADPYVKCYLHPDPNKNSKQKTRTISKTLDPEFDEEFRYPVRLSEIHHKTLAITVWDYDWNSANDFIGAVYLSEKESGTYVKHFMDAVTVPNCLHTMWHTMVAERRKFP
ncbi:rabphilin-1-like [Sycon ciliatum]|uniref:rabphilin-1-like n=1 Tax=Sycon ciliatum TaxID=27933 RepID=UPI0031F67D9D